MTRGNAAADVAGVLSAWCPPGMSPLLADQVRNWVSSAEPGNAATARRMLNAVGGIAGWVAERSGAEVPDVRLVFDPRNVDWWISETNRHRSRHWCRTSRWLLRRVGRVVYSEGWPPTRPLPRSALPVPYGTREEYRFRLSADVASVNRAGRCWLVAAALGAGLRGTELAGVRADGIVALDGGRLAVHLRGRAGRLVPVRVEYTALVRHAVEHTDGGGRLIGEGVGRNVVYELAKRVEGLSMRRARMTWLTAHIEAGTALPVLRAIAGPLSADTLNTIARVIEPPHPHDAAARALHI